MITSKNIHPHLVISWLLLSAIVSASAFELKNLKLSNPSRHTPSIPVDADPDNIKEMIDNIRSGTIPVEICIEFYSEERIKQSDEACRLLAKHFVEKGNKASAIEWFNYAIRKKRSMDNYTALAEFHRSIGNEAEWLNTLEKALINLKFDRDTDAQINHLIARHFIETGEWEKALPYQEAAALRGQYWALQQAAWLNAALGNTGRGLMFMEQDTWHNKTDRLFAYILAFDVTPNKWDIALMDAYIKQHSKGNGLDRSRCACITLIRNDYEATIRLREDALRLSNDPWHGVFAALICEEQGWTDRRDNILQEAIQRWPDFQNKTQNRQNVRTFITLFVKANQEPEMSSTLKEELQQFLDGCGAGRTAFTRAFVGELFRLKGEEKLAVEIHSDIISVFHQRNISEYISFRALRLLGEDPIEILNERRKQPIKKENIQ